MRKVKLLALLLAVLMVVTAFAGCANTDVIESDVANLDERVTALENLLNGIDKEIDDVTAKIESVDQQIADLKGAVEADKTAEEIAALEKQLADQKAALEAQKAAAEAAQKAAEEAKKAAEKAAADQKAANDALLQQIQNILNQQQADKDAAAKVLADAKTAALAKIATIEADLAGKYADLVAAAKAAVNAATTENACDKAVTDLEAAIVAADAAAGAANLAAAQKTAAGDIAVIREQKAADKVLYFANDYQAIVKALATADAAVAAAKTAGEVGAAVATLNAELAKYVAIDDALYAFVDGLWKNISEANRPLYNEMVAYMEKLVEEFKITSTLDEIALADKQMDIIQYVYGEDANGDKKVVNLVYMVEYLYEIYSNLAGQNGGMVTIDAEFNYNSASYRTYSEITSDIETYNLAKATEEAKKLDTRINDFLTNKNYKENYAFLRAPDSFSMFGDLNDSYETFMANTKIFDASVRALVSKLSEVERLKGIIDNYIAAEKALLELGTVDYTTQTVLNVFEEHGYDADYDYTNNPFYNVDTKKFTTDVVFKPIDAELASWTSAYKLTAEDSTAIINAIYTKQFYNNYKVDKEYVKFVDDKYAEFKKDIVPLITALAGQKAVNVSAFEAYKALDTKIVAWAAKEVKISSTKYYNYVNEANLELMFGLLGEAYADVDLLSNVASHAVATKVPNDTERVGYYGTTNPATSMDWLNSGLVDFKNDAVEYFFTVEFDDYKDAAKIINDAIKALAKDLTDRKLYSILPILAIEDKTIVLDGETYLAMSDATALLALKDYTGALAYEYSADGSTKGVVGYYSYISDVVSGAPSVTIREFEEECNENGYADLAAYLIKYNDYNSLKSNFEKRIKELLDNGATKFIADVKAVKTITLANDTIAANPGDRLYNTNYNKYSSGDKVYYVTLADEAKYDVAKATLSTWVTDFAGRTEYQEVVAKEIKFKIENKASEERELTYAGGFTERDILQGYDTIYGNIAGQMKVLQNARTAITDIMTVVESAMAFADLEGAGYDLSEGLDNAVVIGYSVASNGKVTVKEVTGYADGEFTIVETTFANAAAVTYTGSYTIGDMIQDAYTATVAFDLLNADWKSDKKLNTTASALDSIKVDGKAISAIVSELVLFYAKADLIAQLEVYAAETTNEAYIADAAIESIAKCTLLQGTTASAVSNWHEYLAAYFDLDVPALDGMTKKDSNADVEAKAIALYTVVLNLI